MFFVSSSVPHLSTAMQEWSVTIPLKSRYDGDVNDLRAVQARILNSETTKLLSLNGTHDVSSQTVTLYPRTRPVLMHCTQGGVNISGAVKFHEDGSDVNEATVGSVTMMVKPTVTGFTVAAGGTTATISISGSSYTMAGTGFTAYLNGSVWSGAAKFPFPRLLTIVFSTVKTSPVVVTGTGVLSNVSVSGLVMSAQDVALQAQLAYRKPISSAVVTDSVLTSAIVDTPVTVPNTWTEVLVS